MILVILGLNRLHKIVYPSGFDDGRTPGCSLSTLGLQSQSIKLNTQSPLGNQRGSGDESMTPIPMEPSLSATKKGVHLGTPHLESPTFSRPSMYFQTMITYCGAILLLSGFRRDEVQILKRRKAVVDRFNFSKKLIMGC